MRTLYLVRHGQASWGSDDYDRLSALGAEQSRLLGDWFKRCGVDVHHAVAGGLKRHLQTAEAFFAGYDDVAAWRPRIRRDADFNELDQIDMMNPAHDAREEPRKDGIRMSFADFRQRMTPAFYRWLSSAYDHEYKEPCSVFSARCASAMRRAADLAASGETVVAFTSGGTIAMICRQVLDLGDEATESMMWLIWNTSVSRLTWNGERFDLALFNSIAHLEHAGSASLITMT